MALKISDGGTLRTITALKVRQGGVLRNLLKLEVYDGGVLRTVANFVPPLAVSATDVSGRGDGSSGAVVTTAATTTTPTGGRPPYTYAWTLITNGGGAASVASSPTVASPYFLKINMPAGLTYTDVWRVTVTDSNGATATDEIEATFRNPNTGGID